MSHNRSPLAALVTGVEHSGTTHLASLIKCHPKIRGGFECGVLLAKFPKDLATLSPFFDWLKEQGDRQWSLSDEQAEQVTLATDWDEVYCRICEFSHLFRPGDLLLDKCPAYTQSLNSVLKKVDRPCFVTVKRIVAQYSSFKKRGFKLDKFIDHYLAYTSGLLAALPTHHDQIMMIWHDQLVQQPLIIMEKVFEKMGLEMPIAEIETHLIENLNRHSQPRLGSFNYQGLEEIYKSLSEEEVAALSLVSLDNKIETLFQIL